MKPFKDLMQNFNSSIIQIDNCIAYLQASGEASYKAFRVGPLSGGG
jgi:hypothetical protein